MRRSPVRSRSRPPNYFALRKPDAPSGFRRYEPERVGLYSCEFRKAWDSRAVGRRFHSDLSLDSTLTIRESTSFCVNTSRYSTAILKVRMFRLRADRKLTYYQTVVVG